MKYHNIKTNLENERYLCLLNWAMEISKCFSLVWRNDYKFKKSAEAIEKRLRPYLVKEDLTNEWPGTKIFGPPEETLRFYKVSKESINILKSTSSVFSWLAPDYPEDLAFYDYQDNPWFGSVAHEQMAFLLGDDFDLNKAKEKIPGIYIKGTSNKRASTADA